MQLMQVSPHFQGITRLRGITAYVGGPHDIFTPLEFLEFLMFIQIHLMYSTCSLCTSTDNSRGKDQSISQKPLKPCFSQE
jgi:hypothetical protein